MAKVTSKMQITIPKRLAEQVGIAPGDEIQFTQSAVVLERLIGKLVQNLGSGSKSSDGDAPAASDTEAPAAAPSGGTSE